MAVLPLGAKNSNPRHVQCQKKKKKVERDDEKPAPPPWGSTLKSLFSCKHHQTVRVDEGEKIKRLSRIGCRSGALCSLKRESSKVMQRPAAEPNSPESFKNGGSNNNNSISNSNRFSKAPSSGDMSGPLTTLSSSSSLISHSSASITAACTSSSSSSSSLGNGNGNGNGNGGSTFRGMQHLRRFSAAGCYECHAVVDPITGVVVSRVVPSFRRRISSNVIFTCSHCGEIFTKCETLELHQALKHAVSELCPDDNSRNIVEIIFRSSWLKKEAPACKIDRILKVHNTQKTMTRFEGYRGSVKSGAANHLGKKKHARCVADGNELLRFHCTSVGCSLGLGGSTIMNIMHMRM